MMKLIRPNCDVAGSNLFRSGRLANSGVQLLSNDDRGDE